MTKARLARPSTVTDSGYCPTWIVRIIGLAVAVCVTVTPASKSSSASRISSPIPSRRVVTLSMDAHLQGKRQYVVPTYYSITNLEQTWPHDHDTGPPAVSMTFVLLQRTTTAESDDVTHNASRMTALSLSRRSQTALR